MAQQYHAPAPPPVEGEAHARGPEPSEAPGPLGRRVLLGVACALIAVLLAAAARSEAPNSDRMGRRVELIELIAAEQARTNGLAARAEELAGEVAAYQALAADGVAEVEALQARVDAVAAPAGFTGVIGPGLAVTLTDSTRAYDSADDLNDLVIHEQDLQAVINALWAGGAEAMSVNGERVLATTAIRCVGNTLLLHGRTYSPPYVIHAVGDTVALRAALARDPVVARFAAAVEEFELGYEVVEVGELSLPAYAGLSALQVAEPAGAAEG